MKRNLLLIVCTLLCLSTQAQSGSTISVDGRSVGFSFFWKDYPYDFHWESLGFKFLDMQGLPNGIGLNHGQSFAINVNISSVTIPLGYHWLIGSGLGFEWTRYQFQDNYALKDIGGVTQFIQPQDGVNWQRSRLRINYLNIPFLLEYQTRAHSNTFFINAGPIAQVKLYSKSSAKKIIPHNESRKVVFGRGMNIRPINFRLMAQIGFDEAFLTAYYSPFSMFFEEQGPELQPFAIGLSVAF